MYVVASDSRQISSVCSCFDSVSPAKLYAEDELKI